jgi:hypothetical protein
MNLKRALSLFLFLALCFNALNAVQLTIKDLGPDDPGRYEAIRIDVERAIDEIQFWSRQESEHMLFFHLGIEEHALKQRALELHYAWEKFRSNFFSDPNNTMDQVLPLLKESREYHINIITRLLMGQWLGWIFPRFAIHVTLELDYLVDKLNGVPFSREDEIAFWNTINGDHADFDARLLDPTERLLIKVATYFGTKFKRIPASSRETARRVSLQASYELDVFHKTARQLQQANLLRSVIHPKLTDHVIREGERSIQTLESFK